MKEIKIQNQEDDTWITTEALDIFSREEWVQVQRDGGEPEWIHLDNVHPADKVAITVEKLANTRYKYVPNEDIDRG